MRMSRWYRSLCLGILRFCNFLNLNMGTKMLLCNILDKGTDHLDILKPCNFHIRLRNHMDILFHRYHLVTILGNIGNYMFDTHKI